jgi:hypothetical protein
MPGGRRWSKRELHILRSRYPTEGPLALSKTLKRSRAAIKMKALEMGVSLGELVGWVECADVAAATGHQASSVRDAALASGHAKRIVSGERVWAVLVPQAWADAYTRRALRGAEADRLLGHYYDVEKAARVLGIHHCTLRRWLTGKVQSYGAQLLAHVRVEVTSAATYRQYLFNPYQLEAMAKKLKEHTRDTTRQEPRRPHRRREPGPVEDAHGGGEVAQQGANLDPL